MKYFVHAAACAAQLANCHVLSSAMMAQRMDVLADWIDLLLAIDNSFFLSFDLSFMGDNVGSHGLRRMRATDMYSFPFVIEWFRFASDFVQKYSGQLGELVFLEFGSTVDVYRVCASLRLAVLILASFSCFFARSGNGFACFCFYWNLNFHAFFYFVVNIIF